MLTSFVFSVFLMSVCINSQQNPYNTRPERALSWYPTAARTPTNPYSSYVNYYPQQNLQSNCYPKCNPVNYPQPLYYPSNVQTVQPTYYYPSSYQNQQPQYYPFSYQNQQLQYYPSSYQNQQPLYYPSTVQTQRPAYYPSNFIYPLLQPKQPTNASNPTNEQPAPQRQDLYANAPTEYVDVDPENFNRIMLQLHAQPRIVSYETKARHAKHRRPHYKVITETKQSNRSAIPEPIHYSQVFNKAYTFNKTFVLHPNENKKEVINLNFVNGEQVEKDPAKAGEEKEIDEDEKEEDDDESSESKVTTTTEPVTTTESDKPDAVDSWF